MLNSVLRETKIINTLNVGKIIILFIELLFHVLQKYNDQNFRDECLMNLKAAKKPGMLVPLHLAAV